MNKLFSIISCAALAGALTACSFGSSDNSQDSEPSFAAAQSATVTSSATSKSASPVSTEISASQDPSEESAPSSEESTAAPSLKVVDEQYFMVNEISGVVLIRDGYCLVKQSGSYATCQMAMVDTPLVESGANVATFTPDGHVSIN